MTTIQEKMSRRLWLGWPFSLVGSVISTCCAFEAVDRRSGKRGNVLRIFFADKSKPSSAERMTTLWASSSSWKPCAKGKWRTIDSLPYALWLKMCQWRLCFQCRFYECVLKLRYTTSSGGPWLQAGRTFLWNLNKRFYVTPGHGAKLETWSWIQAHGWDWNAGMPLI